ncbi:MAG: amidohydrolase family protein, partial [Acidimicrobiia bacterium]|nr:amidohydrolase family protein [Acidimicrobiia bacterium]
TDVEAGIAVDSTFEDQMATARSLLERFDGDDRQKVALTFPTLTPDQVQDDGVQDAASAVAALSAESSSLIVQDGHRGDTVVASDRLGLLGPRSVLSHSIDLGAEEIELLAAQSASVAHNPSAIFSQFGSCPVPELLDAGVTVALGSDATGPDRSSDMFRHMFQATRYHRAVRRDPALLPPGRVIEMATIDAANALGMPHLGSLEPGKAADVIVVATRKPHLTPLIHPVHQVVYYATGADVATVIVGGEVLMQDRVLARLDMDAVLADARREHDAALARSGLEGLRSDRPGLWGHSRYPGGFEPPDLGR